MAMNLASAALLRKDLLLKGGLGLTIAGLGTFAYLRSRSDHIVEDLVDTIDLLKLRRDLKKKSAMKHWTIVNVFQEAVNKNPNGEALRFIDTKTSYTFREVDEYSNRIANWAVSEGLVQGDVVGLIMDNRPEYVITWLGLAKIGVVTSLINTNLTGPPLIHSLTVCNAKVFIVGIEHSAKGLAGKKEVGQQWYSFGGFVPGMKYIDPLLEQSDSRAPPRELRSKRNGDSELLYIYTSGTTGNPKASVIKHIRFYMAASGFSVVYKMQPTDVIYCSLPLYHSAGGMIGVGLSWINAIPLVFRKKFSTKEFWKDIHDNKCTVFQYIGELCRYLLAQPPSPYDKSGVRLAIGNGLRPDIWVPFQERFNIQEIGEFYAATEGNTSLFNNKNKPGAVGYIPPLILGFYPVKLIKLEDDNETPIRTKSGLCVECKYGEKGELIGEIDVSDPTRRFDGYTDANSTNKKILKDVFKKGDLWFRSGDLLMADRGGFFYFMDRLGDTFRWKGENVATSEVESVMGTLKGLELVNVYGVTVPHHDGRAGMAAIVITPEFSFPELYRRVQEDLPSYARPIFLRIMPAIDTTSTLKFTKVQVRDEGFNPATIKEPLYIRDDNLQTYVPLTQETYDAISNNQLQSKL